VQQGFLLTIVINDDLSLASVFPELGLHIGQDEPDLAAAQ
jgi:thiamine monophosphate synthase